MTTTTVHTGTRTLHQHDASRLRFSGVLRSEWIKIRSLQAMLWSFVLLILLPLGIGVLVAALSNNDGKALTGDAAGAAFVQFATIGTMISTLIVAVIGALVVTGEYATGQIRSTFQAVPRRIEAMAAKGIVLAVTTFLASAVSIWVTVLITLPIVHGHNINVDLGSSAVIMPLLGGSVYVTLIGLMAFGAGIILRTTAGAIATVLGLMLVAPIVVQLVQGFTSVKWLTTLYNVLPQNAGRNLASYASDTDPAGWHDGVLTLNGWSGFVVTLAWAVVAIVTALILVRRRDA